MRVGSVRRYANLVAVGSSPVGQATTGASRCRARQHPAYRAELARLGPYEAVARQLIGLRMAHGLSRAALARRAGTTEATISRLESGQHAPSFATLQKIAGAFDRHLRISFDDPGDGPRAVALGAAR